MERERTPTELMALGVRLHLGGLSLSKTTTELEKFGVQRTRKAVHDGVQKAEFQPTSDARPNQVAVDETVVRIDGQDHWLYAAVASNSNNFRHVPQFPTTTTALTAQFLQELRDKHDLEDATFLVDHAQHLNIALQRVGLRFQTTRHGNRNLVERVFREIKRRPSSFSNSFSHVDPTTANSWLQAFAVW